MAQDVELITENPFAILIRRMNRIESQNEQILSFLQSKSSGSVPNTEPYGDFHWLCDTCPGIPASTLRIKSAAGEIPGVVKFGKRVLYEKAVVLNWLRSQTRTLSNAAIREQDAESQFTAQHNRRGGRKAA